MAYKNLSQNREYNRKYQKDHLRDLTEKKKKKRQERQRWFFELKVKYCCSRCGESHPATLDFHHKDPSAKVLPISIAVQRNWSMDRLLIEIAKCEVICSNCHRKEHWQK